MVMPLFLSPDLLAAIFILFMLQKPVMILSMRQSKLILITDLTTKLPQQKSAEHFVSLIRTVRGGRGIQGRKGAG